MDLFRVLDDDEIAQLAVTLGSRRYQPGEAIIHPDSPTEKVFIIVEGTVRLFNRGPDGREVTADLLGSGRVFGISALFGTRRDGLLAEAVTPVLVCTANADDFLRLSAQWPGVMLKLAQQLAGRLLQVEEQLDRFASADARTRLAEALYRLARDAGEDVSGGRRIGARVTHMTLARQIGASRETVSRLLASMESEGYLRREGRTLIMTDLDALAEIAGAEDDHWASRMRS